MREASTASPSCNTSGVAGAAPCVRSAAAATAAAAAHSSLPLAAAAVVVGSLGTAALLRRRSEVAANPRSRSHPRHPNDRPAPADGAESAERGGDVAAWRELSDEASGEASGEAVLPRCDATFSAEQVSSTEAAGLAAAWTPCFAALTFAAHAAAARLTPLPVRRYVPPFVAAAAALGAITYGLDGSRGVRRYVDGAGDLLMSCVGPAATAR